MIGHFPPLDAEGLARLRRLVRALHHDDGVGLPMHTLVELGSEVNGSPGLTVDLDATRELGQPMIVLRPAATRESNPEWAERLSPREKEVVEQLVKGKSNRQIAESLFISLATVKDHVHHILTKSGMRRRAELIAAWNDHAAPST